VKDQAQSIQTRAVCPRNFLKDVSGGGTFGGYVRGNRSTTPLHSLEAPGTTTAHNARLPPFSANPVAAYMKILQTKYARRLTLGPVRG